MEDISYLTDHYDKKIERIKQINAPLNFVFITDQHNRLNEHDKGWAIRTTDTLTFELARNHIRSIQYILDRCPEIGFVGSCGEECGGGDAQGLEGGVGGIGEGEETQRRGRKATGETAVVEVGQVGKVQYVVGCPNGRIHLDGVDNIVGKAVGAFLNDIDDFAVWIVKRFKQRSHH